jgi:SAM-dependent methyltransferase
MEHKPLIPQTAPWYDRLTTLQEGYYYPWRSYLPPSHGEDAYLQLVHRHLHADADVLDAACGHGEVALAIAPHCRSVLGYDRTAPWIAQAQRAAQERGIANARFVCHDSSAEANGGVARLPGEDAVYDLLICSKGPFHWIEGAGRVARPGATLLMLVPDAIPLTEWHALLPPSLQWKEAPNPDWARPAIETRLASVALRVHSWWSFDVPELFPDPEQLYVWLSWGKTADEVITYEEARPALERIFAEYGGPDGLEIRYRRYLWKAVVPS